VKFYPSSVFPGTRPILKTRNWGLGAKQKARPSGKTDPSTVKLLMGTWQEVMRASHGTRLLCLSSNSKRYRDPGNFYLCPDLSKPGNFYPVLKIFYKSGLVEWLKW
jgi:hypothetical protein